ncbi:Oxo-4-hydroxy-4-carboxy-5-ureidoimidazoline decarboxylase [Kockovaella imperatae]|uniref:Oxo-4-hydroxy-4-carboxy-5-ureidoimidazoline decarboxylase n=1 Tax=Kockovaella imperatae TaxID=4999 RepID=A0A1Y1USR4_9TREE|nr:Oxo-4-hydroxy-4-carboxy-5-ureidoimidazoline decarboxylase [Kockovaella imperatae]ORX41058.1 Oxo-4-hydroxy-4-carboxy-5-ureidoimidazoline decarboxylase [Kockovaella imperatae]
MARFDPSMLKVEDCQDADTLNALLSLLLEPTPELRSHLVPSVLLRLTARENPPSTFGEIVSLCQEVVSEWEWKDKGAFINGHPMIGEVKGGLSGQEQGGGPATRPVVLKRLAHLNELYCTLYPGLRYITFVNGRPRTAIVPEMEENMGLTVSPEPLPDDSAVDRPAVDSPEIQERVRDPDSPEWRNECSRAMTDVFLIARARLKSLNLE